MRFNNPLYILVIFWSLPVIVLFWVFAVRKRRVAASKFVSRVLWPSVTASFDARREYLKAILLSVSVILILFSLTRPQFGFQWKEYKEKGTDIIFAVDVSKSMLAEDIRPSRLERAKLAIQDLVSKLAGDRVGIITFSGKAFLQSPPTSDYGGFITALKDIQVGAVPRGGTSLASAIDEAVKSFDKVEKKYRVLVIISDGEAHEGDALKAAQAAKNESVRIYAVGVGTTQGAEIPVGFENGEKVYLKDAQGKRVKTMLDEKVIKEAALLTGGAYIRSTPTNFGLDTLYREKIAKLEKREIKAEKQKQYNERFQIPLAIALLILCAEMLISERKRWP